MFTVSELAAEKIKEVLAAEGKSGWGLRIFRIDGGCCGPSYGMDIDEKAGEEDEVIEKNGLKVFMDRETFVTLGGMTLDFIDDGERQGFILSGSKAPSCNSGCSSCG
ncbi:MAG: iron-sulfur cluster assembly accessory protein [Thermodesulfovibrionales bacterium]|nr:iron-sulfur cluster assembly accessory protein [Thermodesulfovibrionales bacterium]